MSTTTASQTALAPDRVRSSRRRWWREVGWRYIVGVLAIAYAGFPILYIISASVSDGGTLTGSTTLFSSFSTDNFTALGDTRFWTWAVNTLVIGTVTAIATVLMGAAAAYSFSRFRFKGRRLGLTSLLVIQMFPQVLAFVAVFLLLISLGEVVPLLGLNSRVALIMVYLGGALGVNTFLMYGFFNTIPGSSTRPRRSTARPTRRSSGRSSCAWSHRSSLSSRCCPSSGPSPTSCWPS